MARLCVDVPESRGSRVLCPLTCTRMGGRVEEGGRGAEVALQPSLGLMDMFLAFTARNEIDAVFAMRAIPFDRVPALEHAAVPVDAELLGAASLRAASTGAAPSLTAEGKAMTARRPSQRPVAGADVAVADAEGAERVTAADDTFARVVSDLERGADPGDARGSTGRRSFASFSKVRGQALPACEAVGASQPAVERPSGPAAEDDPFPAGGSGMAGFRDRGLARVGRRVGTQHGWKRAVGHGVAGAVQAPTHCSRAAARARTLLWQAHPPTPWTPWKPAGGRGLGAFFGGVGGCRGGGWRVPGVGGARGKAVCVAEPSMRVCAAFEDRSCS